MDAGAIVPTVKLLKRRESCCGCIAANAVIRRAADIITNVAHDNPRIKTNIRYEYMIFLMVLVMIMAFFVT